MLRASAYLALVLALMHLAALVSLIPLPIHLWYKLALATLIAMSVCIAIHRHALLLAATSIRELILKADGTVETLRNDGSRIDARVTRQSTVLPYLIVMLLELPGQRRLNSLVILSDSLPAEERRVLRTWLRWKLT